MTTYPEELDRVTAAAMIGALLGAAQVARLISLEQGGQPEQILAATRRGVEVALAGVRATASMS